MREFRLLSTSGILGYGYPEASLDAGIAREPAVIGVDGGSTDPGPYYLGSGKTFTSRRSIKRDLSLMLNKALRNNIKVVIGTCGGSGGEPHLQEVVGIANEIAREDGLHFRLAVVHAEQDKAWVKQRVADGVVKPLRNVPELTAGMVDRATRIVGMMGPEPIASALDGGAQVVLAGRTTDPAPWAGCSIRAGLAPAPAWYAGKMLECGATAAIPKGHDCLLAEVYDEYVDLEPTNPERRCTPFSVANHALHENATPNIHHEPGGTLDTTNCRFDPISDRIVRVSGMEWRKNPQYTVKLEGAELIGYRTVTMCGTRDPMLIGQIDSFIEMIREATQTKAAAFGVQPDEYHLIYRVYGHNAVMGAWEPSPEVYANELGILIEVVAQTQEIANAVLAIARTSALHTDFTGRLCKNGNMAFPFSPSDIEAAPAYRFNVFHVVDVDNPYERFPIEYVEV
jgi:hypothetical protein